MPDSQNALEALDARQSEGRARYVRAPERLEFPSEAEVPETTLHLVLRTFLFQLLRFTWGEQARIGSDQFVYWRASDPKTCLAPDAFVKLGGAFEHFDSWKTWERGTPEVCVEIVSDSDRGGDWEGKVLRYRDLGVRELVRFEPQAPQGQQLRIWNRVSDDLVERLMDGGSAESLILKVNEAPVYWVVADVDAGTLGVRLALDAAGVRLLPTAREAEAQAREAEAQAREAEAQARRAAEARVRELEELLEAANKGR
jgi:Uma2 family endonuclease